ncbi:hypothetical protein F2Q69_00056879 [Brassica cretica]|uniref:Lil3 protein n=1 Tax=Brassica cretica TaxID=69181 RepID=A0A8S9MY86_BRACR|nr:hypothetical protein F2Q69_00056879 [Brassica cretica]
MALLFSPPIFIPKISLSLLSKNRFSLLSATRANSSDTGITSPATATNVDVNEPPASTPVVKKEEVEEMKTTENFTKFEDARWVNGTWDLKQFGKDGKTDWDDVIVSEAKRRKWLEVNPETTSNDEPVVFDTSIIPWWAWMKRYHLPEAELLNGRAAMIEFFMAYFVDSLTGVGLVDQMGNFFCKTLLFVAVAGVLFIRKNEDVDKLKKLFDETTLLEIEEHSEEQEREMFNLESRER